MNQAISRQTRYEQAQTEQTTSSLKLPSLNMPDPFRLPISVQVFQPPNAVILDEWTDYSRLNLPLERAPGAHLKKDLFCLIAGLEEETSGAF